MKGLCARAHTCQKGRSYERSSTRSPPIEVFSTRWRSSRTLKIPGAGAIGLQRQSFLRMVAVLCLNSWPRGVRSRCTKLGPTGRRLETATHPSPTLLTNTVTYCTVHTRRHSPGIGGAPSGINQQSTPPTRVVGYKFKNLYPPTPNI